MKSWTDPMYAGLPPLPHPSTEPKAYGIDNMRGFANEFEVWAFDSKAHRDTWVEEDPCKRDPVTRKRARQLIGNDYLSTDDADRRGGANCFKGGTSQEELLAGACQKEIEYAMNYPTWPEGACEVAVAL